MFVDFSSATLLYITLTLTLA